MFLEYQDSGKNNETNANVRCFGCETMCFLRCTDDCVGACKNSCSGAAKIGIPY